VKALNEKGHKDAGKGDRPMDVSSVSLISVLQEEIQGLKSLNRDLLEQLEAVSELCIELRKNAILHHWDPGLICKIEKCILPF
jgi:hypothetical protein